MQTLGQVACFKFVLMFVNYGEENRKHFSKIRVSDTVSIVLQQCFEIWQISLTTLAMLKEFTVLHRWKKLAILVHRCDWIQLGNWTHSTQTFKKSNINLKEKFHLDHQIPYIVSVTWQLSAASFGNY